MYANPTKTQWRDHYWKALAHRANKSDWILALAGMRFLDRKSVKKYRFDPDKLVGVDNNQVVVDHNIARGRTVIQGDLSEVMKSWDESRPVGVVMADFTCNGGAKEVQECLWAWAHCKAFENSWMVLNVSVGREIGAFLEFCKMWKYDLGGGPDGEDELMDENDPLREEHRSRAAVEFFLTNDLSKSDFLYMDDIADDLIIHTSRYRAHKMNMDTVFLAPYWESEWNESERLKSKDTGTPKMRRHIGAKLAWNTMRKTA